MASMRDEISVSASGGGAKREKIITIMGIPMHAWTMEATLAEISSRLDKNIFTQHVVVNVAKLVSAQKERQLRKALLACDIVNIDGMGIVWGGRLLGFDIPERVTGIDLFFELLKLAEERGEPVFFLGAKAPIIEQTVCNLRTRYPRLIIAGWNHGYFWDDEETIVTKIRDSGATLLFVAITSPKKEQFIDHWRAQLGVKLAMGVGGTFDIVAGKTKRAPRWMGQAGLEWFFRLLQEPRRMWKRYFSTNTKYALLLVRERLRQMSI